MKENNYINNSFLDSIKMVYLYVYDLASYNKHNCKL